MADLPREWDGKESIIKMKNEGDIHWKQLEWFGWFAEGLVRGALNGIMKFPGERFGRVTFDCHSYFNWDIKAHSNAAREAILNDKVAIRESIKKNGFHGLILLCCDCTPDQNGSFKAWHDELKGGMSEYEIKRIERGGRSRKRKVKVTLKKISVIILTQAYLALLKERQKNWRNQDGSLRNPKYALPHKLIDTLDYPPARVQ